MKMVVSILIMTQKIHIARALTEGIKTRSNCASSIKPPALMRFQLLKPLTLGPFTFGAIWDAD